MNLLPLLNAVRISFALILSDVMPRLRFMPPRPRSALLRPVRAPLPAISDLPDLNLTLSIAILSLSNCTLNPRMMLVSGKYGVITIPVRMSSFPFMSHSRKYLAIVSSSLMLMSCFLKSSSRSHSGISLSCLCFIEWAISESRGTSGYIFASESMNALALCLLSTVFMAAVALMAASVRMARLMPSL